MNARLPLLLNLREQRPGPVDRAAAVLERPRLRTSLRLANVLVHFGQAGLLWIVVQHWLGVTAGLWQALGVLAAGGVVILFVEYTIEGRALKNPEDWGIHLAPVGHLVDLLFGPVSALLVTVLRVPAATLRSMSLVTEDDLKNWVEAGQPEGSLEKGERKMIYSIFHFRDTLVREIMIPRIDVLALDINTSLSEAIEALSQSGHSRVPVYEESIDNVVGLLYAKDLLAAREKGSTLSSLKKILRPAYFVPEAKKVDVLLTEMQSSRVHMAVVVDEYGGVAGLVTLEDIMEEIVGEIQDEYDQAEESLFQQVTPDEYIFLGRIDLDDFNEVMGSHLTKEAADTLAGFIYGQMGRIPAGGESIEVDGLALTVEQVSGRRIRKVRARRIQSNVEVEVEEANADS